MFLQQRLFHFFKWGGAAMFCFLKSLMNLSAGLQKGGKSKMISVALIEAVFLKKSEICVGASVHTAVSYSSGIS